MAWQCSIIESPPLSGSMTELSIESPYSTDSTWMWVLFETEEYQWCASFKKGSLPLSNWAIAVPATDCCFIVSGGAGYWVDANAKAVLFLHPRPWLFAAIGIPSASSVVVATFNEIELISSAGIEWHSPRIAWDGIRFVKSERDTIVGIAETGHGNDREFVFYIKDRRVEGGFLEDFKK